MRTAFAIVLALAAISGEAAGQSKDDAGKYRYRIDADLDAFPQSTPKTALQSALRAADYRRFDYLVAHLSDPAYVDKQVAQTGTFEKLVQIVKARWTDDPESIKELRRFLSDGKWEESGDRATASLPDVKTRQVIMKRVGDRWFLENRQKAEP
jgi:hypothetical protein